MRRPAGGLTVWLLLIALSGCADGDARRMERPPASAAAPSSTPLRTSTPVPPSTQAPSPSGSPAPVVFDPTAAAATVAALAGGGPREATSGAFRAAATTVADRLRVLGYAVREEALDVPAGVSWGVPVPAGVTVNVIAEPVGFDPLRPHVVVGAHLDTVPQAPGAEDNASGVAVLLETARMAAAQPRPVPVVFVVFGAEEPRGPGDERHHYGSRAHVAGLAQERRAAIAAMVSLDRVGVAGEVPVCTGGQSPRTAADQLLAAAAGMGVPARVCESRTSDHWSYEKAGATVARLGGNPYPQYHSPADLPAVVDPGQLDRVGRVLWAWLSTPR